MILGLKVEGMKENNKIVQFVNSLLERSGKSIPVDPSAPLFTSELLDSICFFELAIFLENEFNVSPAQHGFKKENLNTMNVIYKLIP